ncbi:MAG: hypothetical protein ACKVQC_07950 [Elusimicrobiota bacterium]
MKLKNHKTLRTTRLKQFIFMGVFVAVGSVLPGWATPTPMQACRAAYEAIDPWKVFEACGQLVADGEQPIDANVWDWLALADRQVSSEIPELETIKMYWKRSEDSGQITGRKALKAFENAKGEKARDEAFKKFAAYGKWMKAYAHNVRANAYGESKEFKKAVAEITVAIKLVPNYKNYAERSTFYDALGKISDQKKDLLVAVKLSESVGNLNSYPHGSMRYHDRAGFNDYVKDMDTVSKSKRGKELLKDSASAVDWCMHLFPEANERTLLACEEAARATPHDPRGHSYLAATLLRRPNPDFARADAALAQALKVDPKFARAMINRGASLRLQGKFAEALTSVQEGLALDPTLAVPAGLTNLGLIHTGLGNFDEAVKNWDLLLAQTPWDDFALRNKALTLTKAGRYTEALYTSAHLIAYKPFKIENYALRGDIHTAAGNDFLAAQNYKTASQIKKDLKALVKYDPLYEKARESFIAKRGGAKPKNLMEMLAPMATHVREKGNLDPIYSSIGLRTQWQKDGSLRLWPKISEGVYLLHDFEGIYLLPDGVNYQKAFRDGKRGPVESPKTTSSGKHIYPLGYRDLAWFPPDSLPWTPFGSFYFGLLKPLSNESEGVSEGVFVYADGFDLLSGPFFYGVPTTLIKEVSRVVEGDKTIITLSDGLVATTAPGRQARLDIPGFGWFRGDLNEKHLPETGVIMEDNGGWSLFLKGAVVQARRDRRNMSEIAVIDRDSFITLNPNGDFTYDTRVGRDHTIFNYPASGVAPYVSTRNSDRDWRVVEAEIKAQEEKEAADASWREYQQGINSNQPNNSPSVCSRCNGSGQVWQSGGASQTRISAPSGATASQREDFYNSAGSIRTSHSSGGMTTCSACGGSGSN